MAKRKQIERSGDTAADQPPKAELPNVESPSISPAGPLPVSEPEPAVSAEPATPAAPRATEEAPASPATTAKLFEFPRIAWTPRNKRNTLLAASVALAAALGAVLGAVSSAGFGAPPPRADVAGLQERKAMQQSIAHLSTEVASLKTSLDAANKSAHSQVAKLSEKITERFAAVAADVTGSIAPPQTVPPASVPAQTATPVPVPRPAVAAIELQPARPALVRDWTLRSARDGMAFVEGHGEIYQAVLGAPLPGLGPVQTIKREDGRWMVVTPRGIIVSMRDRRYYE